MPFRNSTLVLCCTPPDEIWLLVFHQKSNKQHIFSFTKQDYKRIILKDTLFEDEMKTEGVKMLFVHF